MNPRTLATTACLILLATCTAASAISFKADNQDAAVLNGNALKSAGTKTYGKGVLKADEVSWCVGHAAAINALDHDVRAQKKADSPESAQFKQETAALTKMDADLKAEAARIASETKALSDAQGKVDTDNAKSVDSFNARTKALNQAREALNAQIKAFNERADKLKQQTEQQNSGIAAFNDKVKSLNKQLDEFDDKCADKDYYADDYAAAKAALKR